MGRHAEDCLTCRIERGVISCQASTMKQGLSKNTENLVLLLPLFWLSPVATRSSVTIEL